jgi:hypothetical protein
MKINTQLTKRFTAQEILKGNLYKHYLIMHNKFLAKQ